MGISICTDNQISGSPTNRKAWAVLYWTDATPATFVWR